MAITITGDLSWTGALILFLEALDGGPAADVAGYAFESSGTLEYACTVPEPLLPADRLLGTYRCIAETAGGVPAGVGYVTIAAETTTIRIRSEEAAALNPAATALAVLCFDWEVVTGEVPSRSVLNALRHIRNKWALDGSTKTVYAEDDTTPAYTTTVTADGAGNITADEPN